MVNDHKIFLKVPFIIAYKRYLYLKDKLLSKYKKISREPMLQLVLSHLVSTGIMKIEEIDVTPKIFHPNCP